VRSILRSGWVTTLLVVAGWRGLSELVARHRLLDDQGVLARRVEQRRAARISRALARAGLDQAEAYRANAYAAMPGGVRDPRGVGPLATAMGGPIRADLGHSDRLPAWAVPVAGVGVALTLVPLVRPLADIAPWLAAAGLALAFAAWSAARRA
jgi:hypothetical protein